MDKKFKYSLLLVAFGVVLYAALMNLSTVLTFFNGLVAMVLPLLIGFVGAFVLNVPMRGIEKQLNRFFDGFKRRPGKKLIRGISFILTLACVALVVLLVCTLVIPELVDSIVSLYDLIVAKWPTWMEVIRSYDIEWINQWLAGVDFNALLAEITSGAGSLISSAVDIFSTAVSSVTTIGIGLVLMIYTLLSKDELARQGKKLLRAMVNEKIERNVLHVLELINSTYSRFLSGQCVEACILGTLIAASFSIFGIPYASLTGVVTAVFAFIPYVGAFAACALGAFLVLLAEPGKVLVCIAVYLVVQFVENQFIYPHVVGTSVGLGALWTLMAVILGGKLMGLLGMIFFIPLVAVLMTLLREHTNKLLERKERAAAAKPAAEK